jgi:ATP-dependent Lon protease
MNSRTRRKTNDERLPIIPLRSTAVYPLGVIGVQIGIPTTLELLAAHPQPGLTVAVAVATGGPDEPVDPRCLDKVAVRARVSDRLNMPGGTVQLTLQGIDRVRVTDVRDEGGYFSGHIEPAPEKQAEEGDAQELIARILNALEILSAEVERVPREVPRILRMNLADPGRFADLVASLANFSVLDKDEIVQRLDVRERLTYALEELDHQLGRVRQIGVDESTAEAVHQQEPAPAVQLTAAERASELRQKIKMLQSQLGDVDPLEREVIDSMRRIEVADLPARVAAAARTEVERLRTVGGVGAEAGEIRSYVDWLVHLPWRKAATAGPTAIDLDAVRQAMDDELLGLDEQKDRILDHLAVARLRGDFRGPIPCIVGPPHVGKTALVAAVAAGLGRPFTRIELGGRGESQLVGSRRTRPGAQPGKIAGMLRDVSARDPVIMLQEMDEIGLGKVEGDPIEAMEEMLDWDNRVGFVDRYIDLPVDLSDVIFMATAQDFFRIPRDLRDLMVEIRIAGYTPEEKVEIARHRLLPRLIADHGLTDDLIEFTDDGLSFLAYGYARDAGVGMLRRCAGNAAAHPRPRTHRRRRRRLEDGPRTHRGGAGPAALHAHAGGKRARSGRRHRPGVDRRRRRAHVHRGTAHARLRPTHHHRHARRGDARVGERRLLLRAQSRRHTAHHRGRLPGKRHPRPLPRRRHPQGRAFRRHRRHAGHRLNAGQPPRPPRHRHDRRGHAPRQGAGNRRRQGKGPRRPPRRHPRRHPAPQQRARPPRRPRRRPRRHHLPLRRTHGRGHRAGAVRRPQQRSEECVDARPARRRAGGSAAGRGRVGLARGRGCMDRPGGMVRPGCMDRRVAWIGGSGGGRVVRRARGRRRRLLAACAPGPNPSNRHCEAIALMDSTRPTRRQGRIPGPNPSNRHREASL